MTVCREASSPANAARSATVLPAPTSPVMTPSAVSLMHQRIRATASACPPWRCSIAGARSRRNSGAVEPEVGAQLVQAHHLAAEKHERGRAVIVAVDEAHLLTADQLEELRLLTNSAMDSVAPFTGLLLGQPTLRRRIKLGAFAALDQLIALRYALPGMTEPETRDYLTHHLKLAGRADHVLRRRRRADPPDQPRPAPRGQQHRPASPRRHLRREQDHRRRVRRPRRRRRSHRRLARDHDATLNISTPARPRRPRPNPPGGAFSITSQPQPA